MKTVTELRQERAHFIDDADRILDRCDDEDRNLRDDEIRRVEALIKQSADLLQAIEAREKTAALREANDQLMGGLRKPLPSIAPHMQPTDGQEDYQSGTSARGQQMDSKISVLEDAAGTQHFLLDRGQKFGDLPPSKEASEYEPEEVTPGAIARWLICGKGSKDVKNFAQSTGINTAGGNLVVDPLSQMVIDNARALSTVFRAGAQTIAMSSGTLDIARLITDNQFTMHSEGTTISESDLVFDRIVLSAKKLATITRVSRELVEDAPNFMDLFNGWAASSFAAELDRQILAGDGSGELSGLEINTSVAETAAIGNPDWTDLTAAVSAIRVANGEPSAWITHPLIAEDYAELTTGDGTNAAQNFQDPPLDIVDSIGGKPLFSTNCTSTVAFVGDFSKLLIGIRRDFTIDVSKDVHFKEDQWTIKLTWRGDLAITQASHIHRLIGITHP